MLALGMMTVPVFGEPIGPYCVVRFQHDAKDDNVWQGGTAFIDFGDADLKTLHYASMAALLNEMEGWGWRLVTGFPLPQNRVSVLIFHKK